MVLFRTRSDALEFSYNLFDRYPQYEIFAYKLADEKHAIAKEIVENTNLDDYVDANSSFGKCVVNRRNKYAKKKLKEGAASLDTSKVVDLIQECVHNFSNLIFPVKSDDNFEFSFGNFYGATYRQGTTSFGYDEDLGSFICKISFNGNLLREGLEDLFINTVYHELCHYAV